jgi:K+-sensing histidine kinase KdpD
MGIISIIVGLALVGVLADVLVENDIATAATQSFQVAGTTEHLSMPVLIAIAFVMGAVALGLILAGIRSMRRRQRKMLKQRITALQDENARLHAQRNLQRIVRIPESEPVVEAQAQPAQSPPSAPPPPPASPPPPQPAPGGTSSKW